MQVISSAPHVLSVRPASPAYNNLSLEHSSHTPASQMSSVSHSRSRHSSLQVSTPQTGFSHVAPNLSGNFTVSTCGSLANGIYHIEGTTEDPVKFFLEYRQQHHGKIFMRMVFGNRGVSTHVKSLHDGQPFAYEVSATAPLPNARDTNSVTLMLEVVTNEGAVVDQYPLGRFTYRADVPQANMEPFPTASTAFRRPLKRGMSDSAVAFLPIHPGPPAAHLRHMPSTAPAAITAFHQRAALDGPLTPSSDPGDSALKRRRTLAEQKVKETYARRQRYEVVEQPVGARLVLRLVAPLEDLAKGWTPAELAARRRLVRVTHVRKGSAIEARGEPVVREACAPGDAVVSCIYNADEDACFVTSVDIIALVESLIGMRLKLEPKNRIRRNLEGFGHMTVSKKQPSTEAFFKQIMEYGPPRPRRIQKDIKVFHWADLTPALEKLVYRYSLPSPANSRAGTPPLEADAGGESLEEPESDATHSPALPSPDWPQMPFHTFFPPPLLPSDIDALHFLSASLARGEYKPPVPPTMSGVLPTCIAPNLTTATKKESGNGWALPLASPTDTSSISSSPRSASAAAPSTAYTSESSLSLSIDTKLEYPLGPYAHAMRAFSKQEPYTPVLLSPTKRGAASNEDFYTGRVQNMPTSIAPSMLFGDVEVEEPENMCDVDMEFATLDSIEFQTLREHQLASTSSSHDLYM